MPAPLRLRAKGNHIVGFREGLQAGGVGRKSKFSVTYREARAGVERSDDGVVTLHKGGAVDFLRGLQPGEGRARGELYETPSGSHPMFRILLTTPVCFSIFFCSIMMA